jgi:hypothetical protein
MVLLQQDEKGQWHPIAFNRWKLNDAEKNYPIYKKELLAIKEAL